MKYTNPIVALILMLVLSAGPILIATATEKPVNRAYSHGKGTPPTRTARRAPTRRAQTPPPVDGQSSTVLTDGRVLLIGGLGQDGPSASVTINNPRTGQSKALANMRVARAWHTATMLPDGRVFIFGGEGANGRALNSPLLLDPATGEIETGKADLTARSHHTATLLTDGRVLITGGVSSRGELIGQAQLWDYQTGTTENTEAISIARQKHHAVLLTDGNVLIEGGTDASNNEVKTAELFTVEARSFNVTSLSDKDDPEIAYLAASFPSDRAADVSVDSKVSLRFSKRLPIESIKKGMIKFETSDEGVGD